MSKNWNTMKEYDHEKFLQSGEKFINSILKKYEIAKACFLKESIDSSLSRIRHIFQSAIDWTENRKEKLTIQKYIDKYNEIREKLDQPRLNIFGSSVYGNQMPS